MITKYKWLSLWHSVTLIRLKLHIEHMSCWILWMSHPTAWVKVVRRGSPRSWVHLLWLQAAVLWLLDQCGYLCHLFLVSVLCMGTLCMCACTSLLHRVIHIINSNWRWKWCNIFHYSGHDPSNPVELSITLTALFLETFFNFLEKFLSSQSSASTHCNNVYNICK